MNENRIIYIETAAKRYRVDDQRLTLWGVRWRLRVGWPVTVESTLAHTPIPQRLILHDTPYLIRQAMPNVGEIR